MSPEAMSARAAGTWGILNGACDRVPPDLPRNACDAARRAVQRAESADCAGAHQALGEMKAGLRGLTAPSMAPAGLFQEDMLAILSAGCKASGSKPGARTPS